MMGDDKNLRKRHFNDHVEILFILFNTQLYTYGLLINYNDVLVPEREAKVANDS
jgi:hypothetical protein